MAIREGRQQVSGCRELPQSMKSIGWVAKDVKWLMRRSQEMPTGRVATWQQQLTQRAQPPLPADEKIVSLLSTPHGGGG